MTRRQDEGIGPDAVAIGRQYRRDPIALPFEVRHFFSEEYLSSGIFHLRSHGRDDMREFVGTDVRVCFIQDPILCSEPNEQVQDPVDVSTF